ncbi:MAG TPA: transporter substrate-binding domain-containing protein [Tissierellaceae bacterium]
MKKRLLVLMSIMLVASLALTGCGGDKGANNEEDNTFVVGMEAGYAPFNWSQLDDSNGAVKIDGLQEYAGGYDVEMAKRIAEGLGKELVIQKIGWDGLEPAVSSGVIDAIMAGMSPTDERREAMDFTDNYYTSDLVMIVKKGSEFENAKSIQDFSGAKITGQQGTFHYVVIDQIDGVIKDTAMQDFPSMRVALESGIIDGYVSEKPEGISVIDAGLDFAMVEFEDGFVASEDEISISVGLKKNSELTEKINEILSTISDEERQEIMEEVVKKQPVNQ